MTTVLELLRAIDQLSAVLHHIPVDDVENGEALTVAIDAMNEKLLRVQEAETPKADETSVQLQRLFAGPAPMAVWS